MSKKKYRCSICGISGPASKFFEGTCTECRDDSDNRYGTFTLEHTINLVKSMKEERVAAEGTNDVPFLVGFWRGIHPLCFFTMPGDRDLMLNTIARCVPGFNADGCVVAIEAYGRHAETIAHPSGRSWEQGEFQHLFESGQAEEYGIVECLNVMRFTRRPDGMGSTNKSESLSYRIVGDRVEWIEGLGTSVSMTGPVPRHIDDAFKQPPVDLDDLQKELSLVDGGDLFTATDDIPYRRLHTDLGIIRALCSTYPNLSVGYCADAQDLEELEIVNRSMARIGQQDLTLIRAMMRWTN